MRGLSLVVGKLRQLHKALVVVSCHRKKRVKIKLQIRGRSVRKEIQWQFHIRSTGDGLEEAG